MSANDNYGESSSSVVTDKQLEDKKKFSEKVKQDIISGKEHQFGFEPDMDSWYFLTEKQNDDGTIQKKVFRLSRVSGKDIQDLLQFQKEAKNAFEQYQAGNLIDAEFFETRVNFLKKIFSYAFENWNDSTWDELFNDRFVGWSGINQSALILLSFLTVSGGPQGMQNLDAQSSQKTHQS